MRLEDFRKPSFHPLPRFGVATASYQIEGAHQADGKGEGSWDRFCRQPGAIYEGHHGEQATQHYHRLDEDLDLLAELGVDDYRFSVSWPRVLPRGRGSENEAGLSFYERLIDGLLARGIRPIATLFHWDSCQALEDEGGFCNPRIVDDFANYTALIARRFGDRVRHFITLNEPHAFIEGGLRHGRHAPGKKLPLPEVLLAGHHALLCHGRAVQELRSRISGSWITASPVLTCGLPPRKMQHSSGSSASDVAPEEVQAARQATFDMPDSVLRCSAWWMDPLYGEGYPDSGLSQLGELLPKNFERDYAQICQPLDACGFNLYDGFFVQPDAGQGYRRVPPPVEIARSAFDWPITPEAHFYGPLFAHQRYGLPIFITENGLSLRDTPLADGKVHDELRGQFIVDHLHELARAQAAGIPIEGYLHWSLLDNFEWNHGYRERFGLIHVNYETFERTKKESFSLYRDLIAQLKGSAALA